MFQIVSYINFLLKSSNEHGIHSPFVFDLVTKCFYDKAQKSDYSILDNFRNNLLKNHSTIDVVDFGAGSKVFTSNKREIAKIAKTAGISSERAKLLYRLVNYFQPQSILEIGTSLGLATSALALGNRKSKIFSLEGCRETSKIAGIELEKIGLTNVNLEVSEFGSHFEKLPPEVKFDLIYFDGNHQKQATLAYFKQLLPTIHNNTLWVFDDIHWSKEMDQAWQIIKQHPKVTVTIDTFQWGIVFFRKEQKKQDFIIRT